MKKLLIATSLICSAVLAHAAAVDWSSDAFYKPTSSSNGTFLPTSDSGNKTAKGTVMGYLWEVDVATYDIYAADTSKIYEEFLKAGHGALGETTIEPTASGVSRNIKLSGTTDWTEGDTAYALILYTYNDGTQWYIANAAQYADIGKSKGAVASLNNYEGGSIDMTPQGAAITGWTAATGAVPEPTSAMLMLLGFAGLALRRRRA